MNHTNNENVRTPAASRHSVIFRYTHNWIILLMLLIERGANGALLPNISQQSTPTRRMSNCFDFVCVCDFFKYWFLSLTDTCLHSIPWQRVSIDIERDQAPVNLAFFPNSFSECISMVAECVSPIIVVKDR